MNDRGVPVSVQQTPPNGLCIVRRWFDPANGYDGLIIDQADPVTRLSADLLQEISILTERDEPRRASIVGDVLTIHGDNRTVVYRIDYSDWDEATDSYRAEWPD